MEKNNFTKKHGDIKKKDVPLLLEHKWGHYGRILTPYVHDKETSPEVISLFYRDMAGKEEFLEDINALSNKATITQINLLVNNFYKEFYQEGFQDGFGWQPPSIGMHTIEKGISLIDMLFYYDEKLSNKQLTQDLKENKSLEGKATWAIQELVKQVAPSYGHAQGPAYFDAKTNFSYGISIYTPPPPDKLYEIRKAYLEKSIVTSNALKKLNLSSKEILAGI